MVRVMALTARMVTINCADPAGRARFTEFCVAGQD
jgi:hypothetical protein